PAFFILMGSLGLLTGYTSFHEIFMAFHFGSYVSYALGVIATFILIMICMIENSRMPVDDPKTHLELTMIHEVMILDYSGPDLGLILYGATLKLFLFMALTASLLWPPTGL
ncbi:MAG TPA: hydrogenase, partial [Marinilabiliales bacterium]|nr:hydrogenase [Marinilabiliales bacterium]